MGLLNEITHEFLSKFKDFDNHSIEVIFADCFSEFIEILNQSDLSESTLNHLNDVFSKDMNMFFKGVKK